MVYRYVCPNCTAFVRSPESARCEDLDEFWNDWNAIADDWHARHVCGDSNFDGIEKSREFERYEPPAALT